MKKSLLISAVIITTSLNTVQADEKGWYVKPFIGLSQMSDLSADTTSLGSIDGTSEIDLDSGFNAGVGVGYRYNDRLAVEAAWEYRTNDSSVSLADGNQFPDGNYASNVFYLNGLYYPKVSSKRWSPYVGAGLSVMQEIDIDLEQSGVETSLSGSGDLGYQLIVGADYKLNTKWSVGAEARYGSTTGIDLEGEGNNGRYKDLDYNPTTLQLGVKYRF